MRTLDELRRLAEDGVKAALAAGADAAEVYVTEDRASVVGASGRSLVPTETIGFGVGVRVVAKGRVGVSGAQAPRDLPRAIRDALQSVEGMATRPEVRTFHGPATDSTSRVLLDHRLDSVRIDGPTRFVEAVVSTALQDARVTYVDAKVASHSWRMAVANSNGLVAHDETAWERADLEVRCTRGTTHRSGREGAMTRGPIEADVDGATFARATIERVSEALDARPLSSAVDEAILLPGPASQIVGMVTPGFHARDVARGIGATAGEVGARLYSPLVTITDRPRGPEGVRRRNVDDEGLPTRDTRVVEAGRLAALLHDSRTAARAGVAPTGNGLRSSASGGVAPGFVNLTMAPGELSLDEMIEGTERAVVVSDALLGAFTHNANTGDFSVVAPYAFLVENGKVRHALPPTTIGGNAHRVLREVRALGRERKACAKGTVPAIRAGGVSCAT